MRTTMLLAALMWVSTAQAAPAPAVKNDAPLLAQATKPATTDDDEDEPTKPATPPATGPKATTTTPAATTPATKTTTSAPAAATATTTTAEAEQMRLVSGAPLADPNVAVHIVERKEFSDSGRRELVLFPAAMQINGKFTQTFGTMLSFVYHLQENFGLQITGGYNWYNNESAFNGELVTKVSEQAQAATSLLQVWDVLAGVEVTPVYAKFAFFDGTLGHFDLVLNGGAGLGGTRHQLKPESVRQDGSVSPATFGDTGVRFMGGIGGGFRLRLGEHFAFRLEVRDVVYTARADRVNGCSGDDLRAMDAKLRAGQDVATATVSGACKLETFVGTDANGNKNSTNVPLALSLVKTPSSDVLNNLGLYIGASFIF